MLNKNFLENSCTNCGFCIPYFKDKIVLTNKLRIHEKKSLNLNELKKLNKFCPGYGFNYLPKNYKNFSKFNYLIGPYVNSYVGHSLDKIQRKKSSSGGILAEILIFLLKNKLVESIYMPILKKNKIFPEYDFIADSKLIRNNSQSIYTKIPVNMNFNKIYKYKKICFVGLPDQTKALTELCKYHKKLKKRIKLIIGPMVGINMDPDVVDGIKTIFNIKKNINIKKLRWRDGSWPGHLAVKFSNNKIFRIKKFYYNFLLPFYCSKETLFSNDFANESADISVGDAWSPKYEKMGGGWSLIWSKTKFGETVVKQLNKNKKIKINKISFNEAIRMHTHILDFKKRGSIYRKKIFNFFGCKVPNDKIFKDKFYLTRFFIELIIISIIMICKSRLGRFTLKILNVTILGIIFEKLRYSWKNITKDTKRKGFNKLNKHVFQKNY